MKIKSVSLENIRSHKNTKIDFEDGIILFSGRTGSGKSSILIAIEYALFGSKAVNSNSEILKRNATNGRVILEFEAYGKKCKVVRGLKRVGDNIQADPDNLSMFIDDEQVPIMARVPDLDKKILDILRFPDDIKRPLELFQVISYTKQDEIRKLIELTAEGRQEHIDNILQLAKYKNTFNNMRGIVSVYENRISEIKGVISSYSYIENEVANLEKSIENYSKKLESENKDLKSSKSDLSETIEAKEKIKKDYESLIELDKKHSELSGIILQIEKEISEILNGEEESRIKLKELNESLSEFEELEDLEEIQIQKARIEGKLAGLNAEIDSLEKEIEKVSKLKAGMNCPTCEQEVSKEHIVNIKTKYENKIHDKFTAVSDLEVSMRSYKEKMERAAKIDVAKAEFSNLNKTLEDNKSRIDNLKRKKEENQEKFSKIHSELQVIGEKREELDKLLDKEIELSKFISASESSIQAIEKNMTENKLALAEKKSKLGELNLQKDKLEKSEYVINLLERLREDIRNIRETVRGKFLLSLKNEFQRKFEELRKHEEEYSVDIKPNYEPVCFTTDGEEVTIGNLSGGEKTTVALAYRLALADIAAKLGGVQKTEVLLLDEPTVGLDAEDIKELPNALRNIETIPQIILVTHVQELKEAADHVYLVEKNGRDSIVKIENK